MILRSVFPAAISRRATRARRGMVLFEVMTAIFIFTVVAFAIVVALDKCLDAAKNRGQIELALHGLQNQMALLHGSNIQPSDTEAPDDGTGIAYHVTVALMQDLRDEKGNPVPNIYSATITASWKESDGTAQTRTVSELIYQP